MNRITDLCRTLLLLLAVHLLGTSAARAELQRPPQGNLLSDGGFEEGAAGWSFLPHGAVATGAVDSTEKHEGHSSYRLSNKSGFAPHVYARIVQVVAPLRPFTTYKVSCWAKGKACGINWIGGGPGWFARTHFPQGDFDWQQVAFEVETGAEPGGYELMVLTESQTEALWVDDIRFEQIRSDQARQDEVYARLNAALATAKQKLSALKERWRVDRSLDNAYVRLGVAVAERFLEAIEKGGPGAEAGLAWKRLQLEEVAQVLDETKRLVQAHPDILDWHPPGPGTVALKDGSFYERGRPHCFYGYGHFQAVIDDLPNFPALGATLIQDGRAGPSSMNEDGTLSGNASNVLFGLDRTAQCGMRVDFLLSPHYYPDWGRAADMANGNIGFLGFNIFHPKARAVIGQWAQVMARELKKKPALHSVCLANEPVYNCSGRDSYTRPQFTAYLREKHRDIATLNALYGTSYSSFEQVPVPPDLMPKGQGPRRAYYDWTTFNKQMFAGWHSWLGSILKQEGLKAPTHTKIMIFQTLDRDKQGHGVDPELMCRATDLAGCDAYAFMVGSYAYDWMGQEFFYDLLHSFRGQPVFNSENHVIPDGSGPVHIPMQHTRSVLWQGGLHHQGATAIWVWEKAGDPSLVGSIYFRPANVYGAGRAMLDLNRLGKEVQAINSAPPSLALLYSQPSIFWDERYHGTIYALYAALNFLGQNITFVSERQLAEGTAAKVHYLLVPGTHVLGSTPATLRRFANGGSKIVLVGNDALSRDEYDRSLEGAGGFPRIDLSGSDRERAAALRSALSTLSFVPLVNSGNDKPAWGVEFRTVKQGKRTLIPLVNLSEETQTVRFAGWERQTATDLLSGEEVNLDGIRLESMVPRLLRIATRN